MTIRERFQATMHYQPRDRAVIADFSFWPETLIAWHEQGLPRHVRLRNADDFFGMDSYWTPAGVNVDLCPAFEVKVLEDRGDEEVVQQADGVRVLRHKRMSSIPVHLGHRLIDRESWRKDYKPRLDPSEPARFAPDFHARIALFRDPNRAENIVLPGGSLFGRIRDWMGLEAVSLAVYDDPAWFAEMVETCADCVVGVLEKAFATGGRFDALSMWEDMCYNSGPLLSPAHFREFLVPHYRRITALARKHGVDVIWVDCDGKIDDLIPLWMEAGVNCMFPCEVGTWAGEPVRYRREYGRDLLLMGGFDKRILARGPREIDAEIRRLTPIVEEGGYIPFCDHRVPPDVPLASYWHYLTRIREVWGRGVNLKPMGQLEGR